MVKIICDHYIKEECPINCDLVRANFSLKLPDHRITSNGEQGVHCVTKRIVVEWRLYDFEDLLKDTLNDEEKKK